MVRRIINGYVGAILLPAILYYPFGNIWTMGGHSMGFILFVGAPVGLIAGLAYTDYRNNIKLPNMIIRSFISFLLILLLFITPVYIKDYWFMQSHGKIIDTMIFLIYPIIISITTNKIYTS